MTQSDIAELMYTALAHGDKPALLDILAEDLIGMTTDGLPLGLGGRFEGRTDMLRNFYGRIARNYRARAEPAEFINLPDGRLLVRGRYRGSGLTTGRSLNAAFVHFLSFRDGQVVEIIQLTDSGRWRDTVESPITEQDAGPATTHDTNPTSSPT